MKKTNRIIFKIIILIIIFNFSIFIGSSKASEESILSNIISIGDDFIQQGKTEALEDEEEATEFEKNAAEAKRAASDEEVKEIINDIYNIIFPLGVAITVIVGGIMGINFMLASVEEKAKIKESMVPYVIGCVVIYGAFGIWKIAIEIFSNLS